MKPCGASHLWPFPFTVCKDQIIMSTQHRIQPSTTRCTHLFGLGAAIEMTEVINQDRKHSNKNDSLPVDSDLLIRHPRSTFSHSCLHSPLSFLPPLRPLYPKTLLSLQHFLCVYQSFTFTAAVKHWPQGEMLIPSKSKEREINSSLWFIMRSLPFTLTGFTTYSHTNTFMHT